jgi:hypothetical protein
LRVEGVASSAQRVPTAVNLCFLDRSRYFFIQVARQLSSRHLEPSCLNFSFHSTVPEYLLFEKPRFKAASCVFEASYTGKVGAMFVLYLADAEAHVGCGSSPSFEASHISDSVFLRLDKSALFCVPLIERRNRLHNPRSAWKLWASHVWGSSRQTAAGGFRNSIARGYGLDGWVNTIISSPQRRDRLWGPRGLLANG